MSLFVYQERAGVLPSRFGRRKDKQTEGAGKSVRLVSWAKWPRVTTRLWRKLTQPEYFSRRRDEDLPADAINPNCPTPVEVIELQARRDPGGRDVGRQNLTARLVHSVSTRNVAVQAPILPGKLPGIGERRVYTV